MLFDKSFIDASTEFNNTFRKAENSIRFYDIDNDNKDELILFFFHILTSLKEMLLIKLLIIKKILIQIPFLSATLIIMVYLKSHSHILIKISFSEFAIYGNQGTPYNLSGFSLGNNSIQIKWMGNGTLFYIYRGSDKNNLSLIDSTIQKNYLDLNIELNKNYYYGVKTF